MEQQRHLRILERITETDDTVTFRLEAADGRPFVYLPGQYITLIFNVNGHEKRRAYSFSSSPATDAHPTITVKRIPNGEFSTRLLRHAVPGDMLLTTEANGRFLLPKSWPNVLCYLAAGSGITPVLSHLKTLLAADDAPFGHRKIVLFYASRDSRSTIGKAQLDHWMALYPDRFECVYFFSREKNAAHARFRHLNNELLEQEVRRYFGGRFKRHSPQTHFYVCAPPALLRMARMTLRQMDFPAENFHFEAFAPERVSTKRSPDTAHTHRVVAHWPNQSIEFQTFSGETILDGALRQGIALPYSCKVGVCLSCLARCVRGKVEVEFAQVTQLGKPGDLVNTCLGYAATETVEIAYD